jgi:transcriptional regulator with XRE-family HTH domain
MMITRTLSSKKCYACGARTMTCKKYKHEEVIGKVTVTDETASQWQCSACGEVELTTSDLAGYQRRAAALILRDGRYATGAVLRVARKALGLTQRDLALLLEHTPEWVSLRENNHEQLGQAETLAIVALLEGVEEGREDVSERLASITSDRVRPSLHAMAVQEPRERARRTG